MLMPNDDLAVALFMLKPLAKEEPRLYTGAIEVPTLGPLKMTLGVS